MRVESARPGRGWLRETNTALNGSRVLAARGSGALWLTSSWNWEMKRVSRKNRPCAVPGSMSPDDVAMQNDEPSTRVTRPPGWISDGDSPLNVHGSDTGANPIRSYFHYLRSGNKLLVVVPPLFQIEELHVSVQGTPILKGVDLVVDAGEVHALMGPNGSGKSTLAATLLGNPDYEVTKGRILFKGEDVTDWPTDVRAKVGMFLAFQYPEEIAGVPMVQFLKQALAARKGMEDLSLLETRISIMEWMKRLDMDPSFGDRHLNQGFSGGEKKRNEILQMAILEPEIAILDETDSGLDIDALRTVARGVNLVRAARPALGVLLITHYQRILDELAPDKVHLLVDGRVVASGGPELAHTLEESGYETWRGAAS